MKLNIETKYQFFVLDHTGIKTSRCIKFYWWSYPMWRKCGYYLDDYIREMRETIETGFKN